MLSYPWHGKLKRNAILFTVPKPYEWYYEMWQLCRFVGCWSDRLMWKKKDVFRNQRLLTLAKPLHNNINKLHHVVNPVCASVSWDFKQAHLPTVNPVTSTPPHPPTPLPGHPPSPPVPVDSKHRLTYADQSNSNTPTSAQSCANTVSGESVLGGGAGNRCSLRFLSVARVKSSSLSTKQLHLILRGCSLWQANRVFFRL